MKKLILSFLLLLAVPSAAWAEMTVIRFNELPPQPANGVSLEGVTFGFGPGVATFNAPNGGNLVYVQDPTLEGPIAGNTLTLTFASPPTFVQFGVALSTEGTVTPGFVVQLFGQGGTNLGTFPVTTNSIISFTEGQFTYSGAPVTSASITFNGTTALDFAFDNLAFGTPGPIPAVGPNGLVLLGVLVAGLGAWLLRRRALHASS